MAASHFIKILTLNKRDYICDKVSMNGLLSKQSSGHRGVLALEPCAESFANALRGKSTTGPTGQENTSDTDLL